VFWQQATASHQLPTHSSVLRRPQASTAIGLRRGNQHGTAIRVAVCAAREGCVRDFGCSSRPVKTSPKVLRRHDRQGREYPGNAFVFGDETGVRIKSVKTAWENARLKAHGYEVKREKNARLTRGVSASTCRDRPPLPRSAPRSRVAAARRGSAAQRHPGLPRSREHQHFEPISESDATRAACRAETVRRNTPPWHKRGTRVEERRPIRSTAFW
jgi:hypothetical protein